MPCPVTGCANCMCDRQPSMPAESPSADDCLKRMTEHVSSENGDRATLKSAHDACGQALPPHMQLNLYADGPDRVSAMTELARPRSNSSAPF